MDDGRRAMGILVIDKGVIIRAFPATESRTDIEIAPDHRAGAIVCDALTGRWRYDDVMRNALGIKADPDFATDAEAGQRLKDYLPPLSQVNAFVRRGNEGHG